jgi:hypothetical protein
VVWAATGPWRAQHDAQFLDNGHLLLFDNLGCYPNSRVLEYDPQTQAFPWSYSGGDDTPFRFFGKDRCLCQRLPNGNTLVVLSELWKDADWQQATKDGEILEVAPNRKVVWSCTCDGYINTARRYGRAEVPFLQE